MNHSQTIYETTFYHVKIHIYTIFTHKDMIYKKRKRHKYNWDTMFSVEKTVT